MTRGEIGALGETLAAKYLKKNGYRILERNRHQSHNEIDLIVANREFLVFVEVKTRSAASETLELPFGTPAEAVGRGKQARTVRAAQDYLRLHPAKNRQIRMDVVEVYLEKDTGRLLKLHHIPDAFGA